MGNGMEKPADDSCLYFHPVTHLEPSPPSALWDIPPNHPFSIVAPLAYAAGNSWVSAATSWVWRQSTSPTTMWFQWGVLRIVIFLKHEIVSDQFEAGWYCITLQNVMVVFLVHYTDDPLKRGTRTLWTTRCDFDASLGP